jgi:PIN domain nuclease of toxin-antitoxin system
VRLLLDTHIVLAISERQRFAKHIDLSEIVSPDHQAFVSVATLWEISIKSRLGKLTPARSADLLPVFMEASRIAILDINRHHALADVEPAPPTRDPFDRMLLAQCRVEGLQLVTFDRALIGHPLAWRRPT